MSNFLELTLADGRELDIPKGSIVMIEEMTEKTNPNFPDARAFIHYVVGGEVMTALLKETVSDLFFHLDVNVSPIRWLKLTRLDEGLRLIFPAHIVASRMALEEGCQVTVSVGNTQKSFVVKESRREIKKWSEGSDPTEERTDEELPSPAPDRPRRPRRV